MDDLNSSDIEFEEAAPGRFAHAGQQGIEQFINNAMSDRIESKKASKQLQLGFNAPGSDYLVSLWSNRFKVFREVTLRLE